MAKRAKCEECGEWFEIYRDCEKIGKDGESILLCQNCMDGYNPWNEPEYQ